MHHEGHMDDGINLSRSQHEESRTARVIRSTVFLFNRFIRYIYFLLLWLFDILFQSPYLDFKINNSKIYYGGDLIQLGNSAEQVRKFWLDDFMFFF